MKLILTGDVPNLGAPGDIVEVKDGYGRNYLAPARAGDRWPPGARRSRSTRSGGPASRARSATSGTPARSAAELGGLNVTVTAKAAGDSGRLFGSVTAADVVDAVRAAGGPALDRRAVEVLGQIKTVGKHPVTVRLHPEVTTELDVAVVAG